ncbi:MAG: DUF2007 domain-containing protein [Clostridiales bacterium]|nr:DUF2007 domain-containing protein [Clostridiales bacterium]
MNACFYFLTHRCVFSSYSIETINAKVRILEEHGIKTLLKSHNSNQQTGAFGQLPEYQIAYDLYVPNKDFEEASALI